MEMRIKVTASLVNPDEVWEDANVYVRMPDDCTRAQVAQHLVNTIQQIGGLFRPSEVDGDDALDFIPLLRVRNIRISFSRVELVSEPIRLVRS